MTSLQPITTKRLALAGVVLLVALALAVTTAPRTAPGASLRARAVVMAANGTARLAAGGTLASVAPAVSRSLAAPGVSVAVLDRSGTLLAHSSTLPGLAPSLSAQAIRAALANADVRLSSRQGTGERVTALAPIRAKSGAGVVAVTGTDRSARTLSGGRAAVILLCAALLAGVCFIAGLLLSNRRRLAPRSAPRARSSTPRQADPSAPAAELDQLITACVELIDTAPSSVLAERLAEALGRAGVVRIDPAGERFDPDRHHAVERVATDRGDRHNVVAATLRPGYPGRGGVVREPEVAVYRHEGSLIVPSRSSIRAGLSTDRRAVAVGSAVVILSSLLGWKQTRTVDFSSATTGTASENGLHSWGVLTVLIAVTTIAYLVMRSSLVSRTVASRKLPVTDAASFASAGCAEVATIILFSNHLPGGSVQLGFFLALAGAVATALGGAFGAGGSCSPARAGGGARHRRVAGRRWTDGSRTTRRRRAGPPPMIGPTA